VERANVCGLSLGGMAAIWVAANSPERVDRMVLCATSAKLGPPEYWAERAAIVRDHGIAAVADAVVARWFTPAFAAQDPGLVAEMRSMILATPADGYAACCDAIERMDLTADLRSVVAPTLVMVGAQDHATPPEHSRLIVDSIPNGRLEVLEDAAHLMNVERAGAVTDLIIGHLHGPPDRAQEGDR
jgi:3-oxoadipate enol-lactonase